MSSTPRAVWIGLAVAATMLCCGGGAAAVTLGGYLSGPASDGKSPTVPRTPVGLLATPLAPAPSASSEPASTPAKLGGRAKITDAEHTALIAQIRAQAQTDALVSSSDVGYYGTPDAKKDKVYLYIATLRRDITPAEFEANFKAALTQMDQAQPTNMGDVDPGPPGGRGRCGQIMLLSMPTAACAWSHGAGFGLIVWYNRQLSQVKADFPKLRAEVEKG